MKQKFLYKKYIFCAFFFSFFLFSKSFSQICNHLLKANSLSAILHTIGPAHSIIKNGLQIIEKSGSYQAFENIVSTTVVVDANKVVIDLNGYTLRAWQDGNGPIISIADDHQDIVIKNGVLVGNCNNIGVKLNPGAKRIFLENLKIIGCETGIEFAGHATNIVDGCKITDCQIITCSIAVDLDYTQNCFFKNCVACCCERVGFDLQDCKYNIFEHCRVLGVGNDLQVESVYGFIALGGLGNLFYECFVKFIRKCIDSDFDTKAAGFRFGYKNSSPESESKIINCCIDSIKTSSLGIAYGIVLDDLLTESKLILGQAIVDINDLDWSPDCKHIALATTDKKVRVLLFDGVKVVEIDSVDFEPEVNTLAWSPNGKYLAIGTNAEPTKITTRAWVGFKAYSQAQQNYLAYVSFLSGLYKQLYIYKFEDDTLSFIDSQYVGIQDVSVYNTNTIIEEKVLGDIVSRYPDPAGSVLPGSIPTLPNPSGSDVCTYFSNHPTLVQEVKAPDDVIQVTWAHDGRRIFLMTLGSVFSVTHTPAVFDYNDIVDSDYVNTFTVGCFSFDYTYLGFDAEKAKVESFSFDGQKLALINYKILGDLNFSRALDISPDDNFVGYGNSQDGNFYIARSDSFFIENNIYSNLLSFDSAKWNPIACCQKYYVALAGDRGGSGALKLYEYDRSKDSIEELFSGINFDLDSVSWAPNGKTLFISGDGPNRFYSFNPSADPVLEHLPNFDFQDLIFGYTKVNEWAKCGKYVIVGGVDSNEDEHLRIVQVGDMITNCVIEDNKIANIFGGLCGIGIFGCACTNLIDKNLVCCTSVPYSDGIYIRQAYNLMGMPSFLENLYAGEGYEACPYICIDPDCQTGCSFEEPCRLSDLWKLEYREGNDLKDQTCKGLQIYARPIGPWQEDQELCDVITNFFARKKVNLPFSSRKRSSRYGTSKINRIIRRFGFK